MERSQSRRNNNEYENKTAIIDGFARRLNDFKAKVNNYEDVINNYYDRLCSHIEIKANACIEKLQDYRDDMETKIKAQQHICSQNIDEANRQIVQYRTLFDEAEKQCLQLSAEIKRPSTLNALSGGQMVPKSADDFYNIKYQAEALSEKIAKYEMTLDDYIFNSNKLILEEDDTHVLTSDHIGALRLSGFIDFYNIKTPAPIKYRDFFSRVNGKVEVGFLTKSLMVLGKYFVNENQTYSIQLWIVDECGLKIRTTTIPTDIASTDRMSIAMTTFKGDIVLATSRESLAVQHSASRESKPLLASRQAPSTYQIEILDENFNSKGKTISLNFISAIESSDDEMLAIASDQKVFRIYNARLSVQREFNNPNKMNVVFGGQHVYALTEPKVITKFSSDRGAKVQDFNFQILPGNITTFAVIVNRYIVLMCENTSRLMFFNIESMMSFQQVFQIELNGYNVNNVYYLKSDGLKLIVNDGTEKLIQTFLF